VRAKVEEDIYALARVSVGTDLAVREWSRWLGGYHVRNTSLFCSKRVTTRSRPWNAPPRYERKQIVHNVCGVAAFQRSSPTSIVYFEAS